jgi:hypothetical protein
VDYLILAGHDGDGAEAADGTPTAGSGFPRAGSMACGRGGGGISSVSDAARGVQFPRPLARIRPPRAAVGAPVVAGEGGFQRRLVRGAEASCSASHPSAGSVTPWWCGPAPAWH